MTPRLPRQRRTAFATTESKTGCTSVGDRLITPKISAVAICCSNASFVSVNSRTFSMAMTAWSAKVWSNAICSRVNGPGVARETPMAPIGAPSRSIGTER
jgi:hypothetical protein